MNATNPCSPASKPCKRRGTCYYRVSIKLQLQHLFGMKRSGPRQTSCPPVLLPCAGPGGGKPGDAARLQEPRSVSSPSEDRGPFSPGRVTSAGSAQLCLHFPSRAPEPLFRGRERNGGSTYFLFKLDLGPSLVGEFVPVHQQVVDVMRREAVGAGVHLLELGQQERELPRKLGPPRGGRAGTPEPP